MKKKYKLSEKHRNNIRKAIVGTKWSEESKKKMSESMKKVMQNPLHRKRISESVSKALMGHFVSEETKRKQSITKLGDKNPAKRPEVREKIRKTIKRLYAEGKITSPFKGKHHSEETKEKIRNTLNIHHINGNHEDNRPLNRMKLSNGEHNKVTKLMIKLKKKGMLVSGVFKKDNLYLRGKVF